MIDPEKVYTDLREMFQCCRTLTYHHESAPFPYGEGLLELTYLELHIFKPEPEEDWPDMLTSLRKLRELSINSIALSEPLVISGAAELTRLVVDGDVVSSSRPALEASHKHHPSLVIRVAHMPTITFEPRLNLCSLYIFQWTISCPWKR